MISLTKKVRGPSKVKEHHHLILKSKYKKTWTIKNQWKRFDCWHKTSYYIDHPKTATTISMSIQQ